METKSRRYLEENSGLSRRFSSQDLERMQSYCAPVSDTSNITLSASTSGLQLAHGLTTPLPSSSSSSMLGPFQNWQSSQESDNQDLSHSTDLSIEVQTPPLTPPTSPKIGDRQTNPSSPPVQLSYFDSDRSGLLQSPYLLTRTPASFLKNAAQRMPLKYIDPDHPLYSSPDELMFGIAVQGMTGDGLKAEYVPATDSPFSFSMGRSPQKSLFAQSQSSPLSSKLVNGRVFGWKRKSAGGRQELPEFLSPPSSRLQLSYSGPLPVPSSDRFEPSTDNMDQHRTEDAVTSSPAMSDDPLEISKWFDISQFGSPLRPSAMSHSAHSSIFETPSLFGGKKRSFSELEEANGSPSSWTLQRSGLGLGINVSAQDGKPGVSSGLLPAAEVFGVAHYPAGQDSDQSDSSTEFTQEMIRDLLTNMPGPLKRMRTVP